MASTLVRRAWEAYQAHKEAVQLHAAHPCDATSYDLRNARLDCARAVRELSVSMALAAALEVSK